ncbi:MAG: GtrA family protein [Anaerolineales bacterium]|nr:GtrA family protein [Anaerolineales bacterium]
MIQTLTNIYQSRPKEFNRFVKFAMVGAFGAIIDFGLLNLALYVIRNILQWDLLAGFNINGNLLIANTLSVSVAMLSNFIWNRYWTFPESRSRKKRTQLPQFALVNLIGLVINNLIVIGVDYLLFPYVGEPWSYNIAKAFAIGIVLFWNFGVNRLWTYRGL